MLAILGLFSPFLGILGSLLPSIVNIWAKKQEYAYDLQLIKLQGDIALQTAQSNLDIENAKADAAEGAALYGYDSNLDGGKFINAVRTSVRPIITYVFFIMFVVVKSAAAYNMIQAGLSMPDMLQAIWDEQTMSLFSTIIAFWFGSRVLEKLHADFTSKAIQSRKITIVPRTK